MNIEKLKSLSNQDAEEWFEKGTLTPFEFYFRQFLLGERDWPTYTREDLLSLRQRLDLTQQTLAALLKVSKPTVVRWERDGEQLPSWANIVLAVFDRMGHRAFALMRTDELNFLQDFHYERPDCLQTGFNYCPATFSPTHVEGLRKRLQLSRKEFADLIEVSPSTIDKWESGAVQPKGPALILLRILWIHGTVVIPNEKNTRML